MKTQTLLASSTAAATYQPNRPNHQIQDIIQVQFNSCQHSRVPPTFDTTDFVGKYPCVPLVIGASI